MITPTLGLDLPTFSEIKAMKSVPFGGTGAGGGDVVIFSSLNAMSAAILQSLSPQSQPSSDPNLSSLVTAGITWLGSTLGEPDLQVKKEFLRKRDGKKKDDNVIERHPLYPLMKRPNPQTSGSTLWRAFAYSWIIDGNAYFIKYRNNFGGRIVQLRNEPYFTIQARWVNDNNGEYIPASKSESVPVVPRNDSPTAFINYYELNRDGRRYRVEPDDVIHFRDGEDPYRKRYGLSRMKTIMREIFGDSAAASYAAALLAGNGVIPYVIGIDDKEGVLGQEDIDNIKAKLVAQTTGANAGQGVVLTARATFNRTGLTPQELDLRQSRYMAQEIFAQVTGIPVQVLNMGAGGERSTFHNMEEADRRAVDQYLQPLWWHIAQELTHQLLPDLDQDDSHFIEFDLSEVGALQENEDEKVKRIVSLYEGGLIKRSEGRTEFDYEVDPGGADDVYYVKAGASTVTIEGEQAAQELAMSPPPPPQIGDGSQSGQQPLALVQKKQAKALLEGAPSSIKQLYSAK
jgi:HK97 family phage portal protein